MAAIDTNFALQHTRDADGATIAPTTDPTIHNKPPLSTAVASARLSRAGGSADTTTAREQPGHEPARPQQQLSDAAIIQRGDRPTRRPSGRAAAAAPPELGTCRRPRGAGRRGNKRCKCFSKPHRRRPRQGEGRRRRRVHALGSPQLHQLGVLVALRVVQLSPECTIRSGRGALAAAGRAALRSFYYYCRFRDEHSST